MRLAKAPVTAIAIATYIVMGGFFTQSGVILDAAAAYFHTPIPETATLFSYLTGGNLIGLIVCLFAFNVLSIRRVLLLAYLTLFAGVALLGLTRALPAGALAIGLCGFGAGVGLSAGAVIIAKTYVLRSRAVAFLGTDCTFSLSGYVFPAFAANAIALGWNVAERIYRGRGNRRRAARRGDVRALSGDRPCRDGARIARRGRG